MYGRSERGLGPSHPATRSATVDEWPAQGRPANGPRNSEIRGSTTVVDCLRALLDPVRAAVAAAPNTLSAHFTPPATW